MNVTDEARDAAWQLGYRDAAHPDSGKVNGPVCPYPRGTILYDDYFDGLMEYQNDQRNGLPFPP